MSDHWIVLTPQNPHYVPSKGAQQWAIDRFRALPPRSNEVKAETSDQIEFIDCGANFKRIVCHACAQEIDQSWWALI